MGNRIYYRFTTFAERALICAIPREPAPRQGSTPRMKSGVSTFRLPEVEAPLFRVQCYAVERHFRGSEYNSLIPAVFASARPLKSTGNRLLLRNSLPLKMSAGNVVTFRAQYKTCAVPPRHLCWIYLHWIIQRWKNLRRKIQCN